MIRAPPARSARPTAIFLSFTGRGPRASTRTLIVNFLHMSPNTNHDSPFGGPLKFNVFFDPVYTVVLVSLS